MLILQIVRLLICFGIVMRCACGVVASTLSQMQCTLACMVICACAARKSGKPPNTRCTQTAGTLAKLKGQVTSPAAGELIRYAKK